MNIVDIAEIFKKQYILFLDDLKDISPHIYKNRIIIHKNTVIKTKSILLMREFYNKIMIYENLIKQKKIILFTDPVIIFDDKINLSYIYNSNLSKNNKKYIWKNLDIMLTLANNCSRYFNYSKFTALSAS